MRHRLTWLPTAIVVFGAIGLWMHGPIAPFDHAQRLTDRHAWDGLPSRANRWSSVGLALIAWWGMAKLWPRRHAHDLRRGWPGYALFLGALVFMAVSASLDHGLTNDARLLFERLPIALACAGLLSAVRAETVAAPALSSVCITAWLGACAIGAVLWACFAGDLRPAVLLQAMTLVLLPLWLFIYDAQRTYGIAVGLTVLAILTDLNDERIGLALGWVSGHTLGHLLTGAAVLAIVSHLVWRVLCAEHATRLAQRCPAA